VSMSLQDWMALGPELVNCYLKNEMRGHSSSDTVCIPAPWIF
jgi:hypothetical protein